MLATGTVVVGRIEVSATVRREGEEFVGEEQAVGEGQRIDFLLARVGMQLPALRERCTPVWGEHRRQVGPDPTGSVLGASSSRRSGRSDLPLADTREG